MIMVSLSLQHGNYASYFPSVTKAHLILFPLRVVKNFTRSICILLALSLLFFSYLLLFIFPGSSYIFDLKGYNMMHDTGASHHQFWSNAMDCGVWVRFFP